MSVDLSTDHSDITRLRRWLPFARGNHLDCAEIFPKVSQTTGNVDVLFRGSGILGPTSRRVTECSNIYE
jgi:hypothetical protein